jgi:hypothetical protein
MYFKGEKKPVRKRISEEARKAVHSNSHGILYFTQKGTERF